MTPLMVFIYSIIDSIPEDGSQFTCESNGMIIHVKSVAKHKIAEAVVEALDKAAADIESCEIAGPGFINFTNQEHIPCTDHNEGSAGAG